MLLFTAIGNLGGDAELHRENGSEFVSFRVAHTERYTAGNGQQHEETTWVSCILNGDGGELLKYLVKGQQVYVTGDGSVRQYHSKTAGRLVAGANIRVRSIQLVGGRPDPVPHYLFTGDGKQVSVTKFYMAEGLPSCTLFDRTGTAFRTDANGWVSKPLLEQQVPAVTANNEASDKPFDGQGYPTVEEAIYGTCEEMKAQ